MDDDDDDTTLLLLYMILGLWFLQRLHVEQQVRAFVTAAVTAVRAKRELESADASDRPAFRRHHLYDWRRARQCIYDDYWGAAPTPRFNDKQFERVFCLTCSIADRLLQVCALRDKFFRENEDIHGNPCIDPKAKLLMGLKILAYRVSPSAYIDYFQMSLTTGTQCVKKLVNITATEPSLPNEFLRKMTRDDTKRISDMASEE